MTKTRKNNKQRVASSALTVSPEQFAETAFSRVSRAMRAYQECSSGSSEHPPSAVRVAEIALDAGIAIESALKCIVDHFDMPRSKSRETSLLDLFDSVMGLPEVFAALGNDSDTYGQSIDVVRQARNRAVHGGNPRFEPQELLPAVRDTIRVILTLGCAYEIIGKQWSFPRRNVHEELWAFDGQPAFFGSQVRNQLSNREFRNLPAKLRISRYAGGSGFWIRGPFNVTDEIDQSRWGAPASGLVDSFDAANVEIGIIPSPDFGDNKRHGSRINEGTVTLIARDIDASMGMSDDPRNPAIPYIRLRPDNDSEWMTGPGDLRLIHLRIDLPYVVDVKWFMTPDGRFEVCSEFLESTATGSIEGLLGFQYPGHLGQPAYRGFIRISGSAGACSKGSQIMHWRTYRHEDHSFIDPLSGEVASLRLWSDLRVHLEFGEVEVFT